MIAMADQSAKANRKVNNGHSRREEFVRELFTTNGGKFDREAYERFQLRQRQR